MAGTPGTFRFPKVNAKPSAPPVGYCLIYIKTDDVMYLQDDTGTEVPLGSSSAITQLTGDVTASGPGPAVATVVFVGGASAADVATATAAYLAATSANTPNTLVKRDGSGDFVAGIITAALNGNATTATTATSFSGSLVGDVTGTQGATVVSLVGGSTASNVHLAELAANAATSANTASTIVKRDASGNFAANIITANLSGNATTSTTSTNFTGSLSGDVTGTQSATVVAFVGASSAANVHLAELAANAATSVNTASTIVKRDASGNFAANIISATLNGNASTSTNFTGSLAGDVSGTQGATSVDFVGTSTAANVHLAELAANAATSVNTASTIVKRDASGNFTASVITANLTGNVTGNVSGTALNVTGVVDIPNGGTNSSTALNNNRVMKSSAGKIVEAAAITPARALISDVNGIPTQSVTTSTELSYVSGVTSSIQAQLNAVSGNAITQLTGDVTAVGPGSVAATVAAIQGTTVSGTTGTGNVVFSASPTFTGTIVGAAANFSGAVTASNLSGTNTGDVTVLDSDSIDFTLTAQQITAVLKLSSDAADSGNLKANVTVHSGAGAGLHVEYLYGTPVQIGTANSIGTGNGFALFDHVHSHGNQTSGTLHAAVTSSVNGFMIAADKVKLDASTALNTPSTLVFRDGSGNFAAGTITASLSGNATTATTATNFSGSLSGDVTGTQSATVVALVGTSTAANVHLAELAANAATAVNTASTIVKRDASGNFAAGTITASLSGNATTATTATNFSGSLSGDVTGTQSATVVALVGGKTAAAVAQSVTDTQAATSANTASTIVKRDGSGGFSAGAIVASSLAATGTVTGSNLSGTNTGDVTLAAFGSTPNANGASLSGQVLNLQPADGSNPGGVSTTTQTFAGNKTFSGQTAVSNTSTTAFTVNTNALIVDATNKIIGVGITPDSTVALIDAVNNTGGTRAVQLTSYGASAGYRGKYANGTSGSPTAAITGNILNFISGRGYGATGFAAASTGAISITAAETFTDTSMKTYIAFNTTPTGSVTSAEAFRVASTGVTIGPQASGTGIHQINGGLNVTTRTTTTSFTVDTTTTDYLILCNNSGAITITLPTPTVGRVLVIKDIAGTANTNNVTIARHASEKIEGLAASFVFQTNWGSLVIYSNGTDWFVN